MTSPAVCPDQTQEHLEARRLEDEDKENQNPATSHLDTITKQLDILTLNRRNGLSAKPMQSEPQADPKDEPEHDMSMFNDPVIMAERAKHLGFIGEALDMARLALRTNETPVGCVLVHNGKVIARGMNATNVTRNGKLPDAKKPRESENNAADAASDGASENGSHSNLAASEQLSVDEGNEDGSKGHLYPYGQRLYPVTEITPEIIKESILYVTVEPCVMCASLLRQLGIKKVYFGAVNDKFGGTGGVFSIHANSLPIGANGQTASAHPQPKPIQYPDGGGSLGTSFPEGGGDGGNVEPGYEIEGAPIPRKKEGRAARLAAMMEKDGLVAFSESTEEQEQGSGHGDDEDNDHNRDQEQDDDDDDDDDDNHNANDNDDDSSHSNDDEELEGTLEADTTGHDGSFEKENIDPRAGRKLAQRDSLGSNTPQENKGY
ncbi:tRNA-specific adenosine deaminase 2 [Escovopsis weberi]|uniref:tRNA-specific adenosine deaminase 2 n=1 Tax=Escovopsis weberi TaxID=150374 RepID=A0A0M9VWN5_ESCWE|nr:tRNA-specific adenosine deaminase 2 [Escovopsis weberi]